MLSPSSRAQRLSFVVSLLFLTFATLQSADAQTTVVIDEETWTAANEQIIESLAASSDGRQIAELGDALLEEEGIGYYMVRLATITSQFTAPVLAMSDKDVAAYEAGVEVALDGLYANVSEDQAGRETRDVGTHGGAVLKAVGVRERAATSLWTTQRPLAARLNLEEYSYEVILGAFLFAIASSSEQSWGEGFVKELGIENRITVLEEERVLTDRACGNECKLEAAVTYAHILSALASSLALCTASGPGTPFCAVAAFGVAAYFTAKMNKALKHCVAFCEGLTEEEGYCTTDRACAGGYCDRGWFAGLGVNECKPLKARGASCSRGAQCATGCCKIHWGIPQCRPSDKCN